MDWIQEPFEADYRVHRGPDAPIVRLRWVYTDQPFFPVGTGNVVLNRIWDEDQASDLAVGELQPDIANYEQDHRWTLGPNLPVAGHVCHPEWLQSGEPWPNDLPRTVYDRDRTPLCCRRPMPCEFEDCTMEPVNGEPASEQKQYAITFDDVTTTTPFRQYTVGDAVGGAGPNVRGEERAYFPLGTTAPAGFTETILATAAGVMTSRTTQFTIDANNKTTQSTGAPGPTTTLVVGGVTTELTLRVVAGVGELGGVNVKLAPALLPAGVEQRATAGYVAAGITQATATALITTGAQVVALNTAHGVRMPAYTAAGNRIFSVVHLGSSPVASLKLYPASGQAFQGLANDAPITLNKNTGVLLIESVGTNGGWAVVNF